MRRRTAVCRRTRGAGGQRPERLRQPQQQHENSRMCQVEIAEAVDAEDLDEAADSPERRRQDQKRERRPACPRTGGQPRVVRRRGIGGAAHALRGTGGQQSAQTRRRQAPVDQRAECTAANAQRLRTRCQRATVGLLAVARRLVGQQAARHPQACQNGLSSAGADRSAAQPATISSASSVAASDLQPSHLQVGPNAQGRGEPDLRHALIRRGAGGTCCAHRCLPRPQGRHVLSRR